MQEDTNTEPVEDEEPNRWESAGKLTPNAALHVVHEYRDTL